MRLLGQRDCVGRTVTNSRAPLTETRRLSNKLTSKPDTIGSSIREMLLQSFIHLLKTIFFIIKQLLRYTKKKAVQFQAVQYYECPLSPLSESRLLSVKKKMMVLDLDETLIHSHHDNNSLIPFNDNIPDFYVEVFIEDNPVKFYVYKRPHVDFFLSVVCQWYDLVIFTASMQVCIAPFLPLMHVTYCHRNMEWKSLII
jgi:hypothetical protein